MEERFLQYAREYLRARDADRRGRPGQSFRTRSSHLARVLMWVNRLIEAEGADDPEALRLAASFHDVGYAHGEENHAQSGARILREYAATEGLDEKLVKRAAFLIAEHSKKEEWLSRPDAPRDLVLLMEADLLDEEGAMGLVLDCMTAGELGAAGYEDAYEQMRRYEPKRLSHNPMVTQTARAYWAKKQRIIRMFLEAFSQDMGRSDET